MNGGWEVNWTIGMANSYSRHFVSPNIAAHSSCVGTGTLADADMPSFAHIAASTAGSIALANS